MAAYLRIPSPVPPDDGPLHAWFASHPTELTDAQALALRRVPAPVNFRAGGILGPVHDTYIWCRGLHEYRFDLVPAWVQAGNGVVRIVLRWVITGADAHPGQAYTPSLKIVPEGTVRDWEEWGWAHTFFERGADNNAWLQLRRTSAGGKAITELTSLDGALTPFLNALQKASIRRHIFALLERTPGVCGRCHSAWGWTVWLQRYNPPLHFQCSRCHATFHLPNRRPRDVTRYSKKDAPFLRLAAAEYLTHGEACECPQCRCKGSSVPYWDSPFWMSVPGQGPEELVVPGLPVPLELRLLGSHSAPGIQLYREGRALAGAPLGARRTLCTGELPVTFQDQRHPDAIRYVCRICRGQNEPTALTGTDFLSICHRCWSGIWAIHAHKWFVHIQAEVTHGTLPIGTITDGSCPSCSSDCEAIVHPEYRCLYLCRECEAGVVTGMEGGGERAAVGLTISYHASSLDQWSSSTDDNSDW